MKLWGRINSINVQKVIWAGAELNLQYERVDAGMAFGVVNTPEYKAMNPNSRVPTIEDDGLILWESNAIVRYLCAKHSAGNLWPTDLKVRADADRWMDWISINVNPVITPVFWGLIRTPADKRNIADIADNAVKTTEVFKVLEQGLAGKQYVAGDRFTMGDIPVGVYVYRWYALDVKKTPMPNIEAYRKRLEARPAYQKHIMLPLT
ncbi:MAG: glutathione S-transferase family protein [Burkholderiales bacterium]